MSLGFARWEGKRWATKGEERKEKKMEGRKEGKGKRTKKVHGLPPGLEPRPVASADHRLAVAATEGLVAG